MAPDLNSLSKRAISILSESSNDRILIVIAGIPGSGKSTISKAIADSINNFSYETSLNFKPKCISLSMDGYHLLRSELKDMKDPETAVLRRGAPFTFDVDGIVSIAKLLRISCSLPQHKRPIISAPTFDHKVKDPVENGISIDSDVNIIFLEGNYLLLNIHPWNKIKKYADECWFVDINIDIARERIAKRHVEAGIEKTIDDALIRVDRNDTMNGIYILEHSTSYIDYTIEG